MEKLYKQAILDAKAIRAGAIANAKASLEEVIGPKIHELVSLSLQEDLEEEDYNMEEEFDADDSESETNNYDDDLENKNPQEFPDGDFNDGMEESTLDEILAELESLNEVEEDEADEADDEEADDEEADDEEADDEEAGEAPTDDTKVVDITLGDLKSILQSVMGGSSSQMGSDEMGSDEDLNLDEILAELDSDEEHKEENLNENLMQTLSDPNFLAGAAAFLTTGGTLTYQIIKGAIEAAKGKSGTEKMKAIKDYLQGVRKSGDTIRGTNEVKELNEARKTIKSLSFTLNEVNLLNAKLLYVNKIFTEKTLSESQKIKVIKSFDKTTNVKEAKNVYEILKESLNTKQKTSLKESIGFASQTKGYSKNNNIIESDPFVSRWQKIAGIK